MSGRRSVPTSIAEVDGVAEQRRRAGVGVPDAEEAGCRRCAGRRRPGRGRARTAPRPHPTAATSPAGAVRTSRSAASSTAAAPLQPVVLARGQHLRHQRAPAVGRHPQVQEPGTGHLGVRDLGPADQRVGQPARQVARRHPGPARGAQRDARGVLAVRGVARPLDPGVGRQRRGVQPADGQHLGRGGAHEVVEQGGGHGSDPSRCHSWISAVAPLRRRSTRRAWRVLLRGFSTPSQAALLDSAAGERQGRPGDGPRRVWTVDGQRQEQQGRAQRARLGGDEASHPVGNHRRSRGGGPARRRRLRLRLSRRTGPRRNTRRPSPSSRRPRRTRTRRCRSRASSPSSTRAAST